MQPTGSRSWIQRIIVRGRRRDLGLGGFPLVSLREARDQAFSQTARSRARAGTRWRRSAAPTAWSRSREAAERVWKDKNPGWRHPQHAQDWMSSLKPACAPRPWPDAGERDQQRGGARHASADLARAARDCAPGCVSASAPSWTGPSQCSFAPTTLATDSDQYSDRSRTWCSTCGRFPTPRLPARSGACGVPGQPTPSSWLSSFWC